MRSLFRINDVIQFNENHKWCGSFGIVQEIKQFSDDFRYLIGVPIPEQGTAYIFSMESNAEIEFVGKAVFVVAKEENDEEGHDDYDKKEEEL